MLSFWESKSLLQYDHIIVGAGIVGLSTAISIKEKSKKNTVLVIDQGLFPTGASTKNAGFACFGSLSELVADQAKMGTDAMLSLVEKRWQGLKLLRRRLSDSAIDFRSYGGYELIDPLQSHYVGHIESMNSQLRSLFNEDVFKLSDQKISSFGWDRKKIKHLVYNPFEGQIDTGMMMRSLLAKASEMGVTIMNNTKVTHIVDSTVSVQDNISQLTVGLKASQIAICTNAFSSHFLPSEDIQPGRGLVLVTNPVYRLLFKGVFHFDEGYYYFRNIGDRVLFGGGRNVDFETEATLEMGINQLIYNDLLDKLEKLILPKNPFEIDRVWTGIMAFGETKHPILKRVNEYMVAGVRLGGMGVAIGSILGKDLAEMMLGD